LPLQFSRAFWASNGSKRLSFFSPPFLPRTFFLISSSSVFSDTSLFPTQQGLPVSTPLFRMQLEETFLSLFWGDHPLPSLSFPRGIRLFWIAETASFFFQESYNFPFPQSKVIFPLLGNWRHGVSSLSFPPGDFGPFLAAPPFSSCEGRRSRITLSFEHGRNLFPPSSLLGAVKVPFRQFFPFFFSLTGTLNREVNLEIPFFSSFNRFRPFSLRIAAGAKAYLPLPFSLSPLLVAFFSNPVSFLSPLLVTDPLNTRKLFSFLRQSLSWLLSPFSFSTKFYTWLRADVVKKDFFLLLKICGSSPFFFCSRKSRCSRIRCSGGNLAWPLFLPFGKKDAFPSSSPLPGLGGACCLHCGFAKREAFLFSFSPPSSQGPLAASFLSFFPFLLSFSEEGAACCGPWWTIEKKQMAPDFPPFSPPPALSPILLLSLFFPPFF